MFAVGLNTKERVCVHKLRKMFKLQENKDRYNYTNKPNNISTYNTHFLHKIEKTREIISALDEVLKKPPATIKQNSINAAGSRFHRNLLIDKIDNLSETYKINIAEYLIEKNNEKFFEMITSENYTIQVDNIISTISEIIDELPETNSSKKDLMAQIHQILKINLEIELTHSHLRANTDDYCAECKKPLSILSSTSELVCEECGTVTKLVGVIFENSQFYNQDGQKTKHGYYMPMRHYGAWRERIHAEEKKTFPPEDLRKIQQHLNGNNIYRNNLDCEKMRNCLKNCGLTQYNDNTSLLVTIFTKGQKIPPKFTNEENKIILMKFNEAINLYKTIKHEDSLKRPHYPYIYYKICEDTFDPASAKDEKERESFREKIKILDWIYLQSKETVVKNDKIYREICEKSDGYLKYRPTKIG